MIVIVERRVQKMSSLGRAQSLFAHVTTRTRLQILVLGEVNLAESAGTLRDFIHISF